MIDTCLSPNCYSAPAHESKFCLSCKFALADKDTSTMTLADKTKSIIQGTTPPAAPEGRNGRRASDRVENKSLMSERYPKYYKRIPAGVMSVDVYAICKMFPVADDSGAINHARKKLLIPGTRTGGKSLYEDIKEARDTLNRWLELHDDEAPKTTTNPNGK